MKSILERDYRLLKIAPYETEILKLEFRGNIDKAIEKMKKNILDELTEDEQLKLKICFLFLYGMSFSQIAEKLSLTEEKISESLKDKKINDLLSFEYQVLFQKNKFRLNPVMIEANIRTAVRHFIKQDGNYQKIMETTGFSERAINRYLSNPNLKQIIGNPKIYREFLETSKRHINEGKRPTVINMPKDTQLKQKLYEIDAKGAVQKRYISLCQTLLLKGVRDMKTLMTYTGMTEGNIDSYIKNLHKSAQFLGEDIIRLLRDAYSEVTHDNELQTACNSYDMLILKLYMDGRYSRQDMHSIFGTSITNINDILDKRSKVLLSEEEYEKLEKHKEEVGDLFNTIGKSEHSELIKDPRLIKIVKSEFDFVELSNYNILTVVLDFMDLYQMVIQNDVKIDFTNIEKFLLLKLDRLEEILTEKAYKMIVDYLEFDELLYGNKLKEKYNYITNTVHELFKNNLDLIKTAQVLDIPVECLIRILENEYVAVNYGILISENIKVVIRQFREEVNKIEEETLNYSFLLKNR